MTRVLVFGVFDFFHPGHLGFLRAAKRHGDFLIVSVARDEFVFKNKGKNPLFDQNKRRQRIIELDFVDEARLSDLKTGEFSLIKKFNPEKVCFGHDQIALRDFFSDWSRRNVLDTEIVDLPLVKNISKDFAYIHADNGKLKFKVIDRNNKTVAGSVFSESERNVKLLLCQETDPNIIGPSLLFSTALFYKFFCDLKFNELTLVVNGMPGNNIDSMEKMDGIRELGPGEYLVNISLA